MEIEAEEQNSFFFGDKKLKNLKELVEVLEDPGYSDYAKNYVSDTKNDYANWVRDVLKEDELADRISQEMIIGEIAKIIREKIAEKEDGSAAMPKSANEEKAEIIKQAEEGVPSEKQNTQEENQTPDLKGVGLEVKEEARSEEEIVDEGETEALKSIYDKKEVDNLLMLKEERKHQEILKKAGEARHFCPKFFDCTKKEFLFGFGIGIILGIVVSIFIKIGAL